ncbi:MAG: hypothetical protein KIT35_00750 [Piscinibacter sp.]|uniref:cation efflux protein, CzcI family n=1 Tax=Piscinibacter sp. TaxID=1903157 RepID=UPI002590FF5A|nr:cation efflux protein, CzcI family [Piscinibacter sp.]MCW5662339.1 hypothetical protein [Piscinibacter sp.]
MRRLFVLFLLVILPFQFAWGAAAAYCAHEKAVGAGHFGHHGHQHRVSAAKADADSDGAANRAGGMADDPDCATCHLGCVPPPKHQAAMAPDVPIVPIVMHPSLRADKLRPDRIERPKWILAD